MTAPGWPEIYPTLSQPDHVKHLAWTFECGEPGCKWMTYHRTQEIAYRERERHHENDLCPYTETIMVLSEGGKLVPAGKSIIEKYWEELDRVTKFLMENKNNQDDGYLLMKGQAQGLAIAIQIISVPHFEDVPAVSRWALKRYKINVGQADFMDTPGVQGYNPMPAPTRTLPVVRKKTGPAADPKTGKFRAMSNEDREHLRGMVQQGVPVAAILGMLKITHEQYEQEVNKISA